MNLGCVNENGRKGVKGISPTWEGVENSCDLQGHRA